MTILYWRWLSHSILVSFFLCELFHLIYITSQGGNETTNGVDLFSLYWELDFRKLMTEIDFQDNLPIQLKILFRSLDQNDKTRLGPRRNTFPSSILPTNPNSDNYVLPILSEWHAKKTLSIVSLLSIFSDDNQVPHTSTQRRSYSKHCFDLIWYVTNGAPIAIITLDYFVLIWIMIRV